ncbi:hypothetical protein ACS0TY_020855 [Phlomoides rotata]
MQKERLDLMEKAIADLQGLPSIVSSTATTMDEVTKQLQEFMGQFRALAPSAAAPSPPPRGHVPSLVPNQDATTSMASDSSTPPLTQTPTIPAIIPLAPVTVLGHFVPQLELSTFDGSNPLAWISQAAQFPLSPTLPSLIG